MISVCRRPGKKKTLSRSIEKIYLHPLKTAEVPTPLPPPISSTLPAAAAVLRENSSSPWSLAPAAPARPPPMPRAATAALRARSAAPSLADADASAALACAAFIPSGTAGMDTSSPGITETGSRFSTASRRFLAEGLCWKEEKEGLAAALRPPPRALPPSPPSHSSPSSSPTAGATLDGASPRTESTPSPPRPKPRAAAAAAPSLDGLLGKVDVCCVVEFVLIAAEHAAWVWHPRRPQQTGVTAGHTNCGTGSPVVRLRPQPPQLFGSEKVFVSQPVEDPGARQEA